MLEDWQKEKKCGLFKELIENHREIKYQECS